MPNQRGAVCPRDRATRDHRRKPGPKTKSQLRGEKDQWRTQDGRRAWRLVFASLFVSLISRSDTASAFRQLFANRRLWAAIAVSALLQVAVVHTPFLNVAFGTVPLSLEQWLVCAAMASSVLWLSDLHKWGARLWAGRRQAPTFTSTAQR